MSDSLTNPDDTLRAGDLRRPDALRRVLLRQQARKRAELSEAAYLTDPRALPEWRFVGDPSAVDRVLDAWEPLAKRLQLVDEQQAADRLRAATTIIFEGAHGALLDECWGFHPHTTWNDCTPAGAIAMLDGLDAPTVVLGALRAYATRHGDGPFPTEAHVRLAVWLDPHNNDRGWQGAFRTGPLDLVLLRYGLEVCGRVDGLVVTCLDQVTDPVPLCFHYEAKDASPDLVERNPLGEVIRLRRGPVHDLSHRARLCKLLQSVQPAITHVASSELIPTLERILGVPVRIISRGPRAEDKVWRDIA